MLCRICNSDKLTEVINLGEQYVSDFRKDKSKPNKYPLVAVICDKCMLVQLTNDTPQEEMYHDNYGFKSGVSDSIKNDLKDIVMNALQYQHKPKKWLDIASNDGTLLSFVPKEVYRVGVDPVRKYCEEARPHADRILNKYFTAEGHVPHCYEVITSISCFYDMPDPNKFVNDVEKVLAQKGIWVIQQNYLLPTMELGAIDNFCHEHLEYYTLLSLEPLLSSHGLEIIDLSTSMVNGGSIRTVVAHKGEYSVQDRVEQQRADELEAGLDKVETYLEFPKAAVKNIQKLRTVVDNLKSAGKTVAILAASTRGATIWQAAGLDSKQIEYTVERNPEKVGKYFSAIGTKIISEAKARENKPDYMIIGPWFFKDEIVEREKEYLKQGGKLIIVLPKLEIIAWQN
jgi:hypothetical protein